MTLKLSGNAWKSVDFNYFVTPNTVMEVDYKSDTLGELQGIGLDADTDQNNAATTFLLYGGQTGWTSAYEEFRDYDPLDGWTTYAIPVGQFFTGQVNHLTFVNDDDDHGAAAGDSFFRNIRVREVPAEVDFTGATVLSYGTYGSQDGEGGLVTTASVLDSGATLKLYGNSWKAVPFAYQITPNTVLRVDYKSDVIGELQGIGLDSDLDQSNAATTFLFYGGQGGWAAAHEDFRDYDPLDGWTTYTVPLGQFFTGEAAYLTFVNDDDYHGNGFIGDSSFRNLLVYEAYDPVDFSGFTVVPYGTTGSQDGAGAHPTVAQALDGGATLRLSGNAWKAVALPYEVTADTILEFGFESGTAGEVHAAGFDEDLDEEGGAARLFQVYGSEDWSNALGGAPAHTAPGETLFTVPAGGFYTGPMSYLAFANDDDASGLAESFFRGVRLFEGTFRDSDHDFLNDSWEIAQGHDPHSPGDAFADHDGDSLDARGEFAAGTSAQAADTDGDGRFDAYEVAAGTDPSQPEEAAAASPGEHTGLVVHLPVGRP